MVRKILEHYLVPREKYIFGSADMTGLTGPKFSGFPYGISIGKRLDDRIINAIRVGPTMDYYLHYTEVNKELARLAGDIQHELRNNGIESIVIEPTVSNESKLSPSYLRTLTVDISHKMVATRAGLGWIGKTDLFISGAFGPRLRLVSLLIDHDPGVDSRPVDKSLCGTCDICVRSCPAQAANGKSWNIHVHRDRFFNARKCREKCGELARERLDADVRICGICVSVCPIGKKPHPPAADVYLQ